jgi:hypothetical protein
MLSALSVDEENLTLFVIVIKCVFKFLFVGFRTEKDGAPIFVPIPEESSLVLSYGCLLNGISACY